MAKKKVTGKKAQTKPSSTKTTKGNSSNLTPANKTRTRRNVSKVQNKRDNSAHFPVVGIGASAGGLEALEELFSSMPVDTGMGFVVVTHQHPGHTSLLPELLGKHTSMSVVEAADGMRVESNHVYVGPPGAYLAILNGTLHLMDIDEDEIPRLPIDYLFRSLAEDQQERAICIVLSGTGTDGTLGLRAIKAASGMAMVEQPQSARYAGMPSSAITTNLVDYVLPPASMSQQLVVYATGPYLKGMAVATEPPVVSAEPMQKIFLLLRSHTGHDFSGYKSSTLRRRIERRMNVHQIKRPDQYVRYMQENAHEIDMLFKELLISVTNFFRDPEAWKTLTEPLLDLLQSRPEGYTLRVWIPGCASGEEVYSVAIILHECMEKLKKYFEVQIFGTDLDAEAIETARTGLYPEGIAVDVSSERRERYLVRQDGTYRIRKEIREMTIFAAQNVIKDPPFTKLDLICCRNLLIYLDSDLQKKLLPIFHYALKPGGLMFLGPSETVGSFTDLFETLNKRWKIFQRTEIATTMRYLPEMPVQPMVDVRSGGERATAQPVMKQVRLSTVMERLLLDRFAPGSVVINNKGDIVFIHGRTGAYLEPAEGQPRNNILEMAREGLQVTLASAMRQAVSQNADVVRDNVRVKTNGEFAHVDISVAKINEPESVRGLLLVTFRPTPAALLDTPGKATGKRKKADGEHSERLERELQYLKESHQTTLEELETSNEELKSTNEELQSTNEELQSTNEELETSKEEMQSLNEELTTVNAELQSKVGELSLANDDMQNLLNSTKIAMVFLDNQLNIKRYTDQARDLIKLRPTDVGRPVAELATNLRYDGLLNDCEEVLQTLVYKETEVFSVDDTNYLVRIRPYRTVENVIDGLVITFLDIERMKQLERESWIERTFFENIVDTVRSPMIVLDEELIVVSANKSFYELFKRRPKQVEGELIYEVGDGEWDIDELRGLLEDILPKDNRFEALKVDSDFPKIGHKVFLLNARRLQREEHLSGMILLAMEDITRG